MTKKNKKKEMKKIGEKRRKKRSRKKKEEEKEKNKRSRKKKGEEKKEKRRDETLTFDVREALQRTTTKKQISREL